MTEIKTEENQQELFSEFSQETRRAQRFPSLAKSHKPILISSTLEQILLAGIVLLLMFCLVFFLGVLRGKSVSSGQPITVLTPAAEAAPPVAVQSQVPVPLPTSPTKAKLIFDDPAKPYSIQLVTYKSMKYAEKERTALKRLGFFSLIIPSGDYYQVCVGQYASKNEAKRDLAYFSSKYKGCYLRRR